MDKYNEYRTKFHDKFMSLNIPTVSVCCCGVDLRTAGLILGGITVVADIILILYGIHVILNFIYLISACFWIYGILKDKPNYMFGYLISGLIGLIIVVILDFILYVITNTDDPATTDDVEPRTRLEKNIISTVILVIAVAPSVYFWIVDYSLYKSILERHTESIGSTGAGLPPSEVNAGV